MTKKRQSFSLEPENKEFLDREDINGSGLVNKLVTQYRSAGVRSTEMLQLRLDQVDSEIESLEQRLENKRAERERIADTLEQKQSAADATLDEAEHALEPNQLEPDNPAAKNWAKKCGLGVHDFISRMEGRLQ